MNGNGRNFAQGVAPHNTRCGVFWVFRTPKNALEKENKYAKVFEKLRKREENEE